MSDVEALRIHYPQKERRQMKNRNGFTLIELLIVTAIVLIMLAFSWNATFRAIEMSRVKATRALLVKINGALQQRSDASLREFESSKSLVLIQANTSGIANGDKQLAIVYARKQWAKRRFPQTWLEAYHGGMITQAEYATIAQEMADASADGDNLSAESAEVLYYILTHGNALDYDSVPMSFTTQEARNVSCSSRPELVDAWGNPLRWYRWPTRLLRPNGVPNGMADPGDPLSFDVDTARLLMSIPGSARTDPDDSTHKLDALPMPMQFEDDYGTVATYHTFLVVSAGADETLGILEPNSGYGRLARLIDPLDKSAVMDNLSNLNASPR